MAAELNDGKPTSNPGGWRQRVTLSAFRRDRRLTIWVVAIGSVLVVLLLTAGVYGTSRQSKCASCHPAQATALAADPHASVTCYQCHLDAGSASLPQFKVDEFTRMYLRASGAETTLTGSGRRVSRRACAQCHQGGPEGVVESRGLRINHAACAGPPRRCDDCHNDAGHGKAVRWPREPVMDECLACHSENDGPIKCDTCHDGRIERERLQSGPWQITHGPSWQKTHGMGALDTCASCHPARKCIGCHKTEIPHPSNFLRTHGKLALAKKDPGCRTCHKTQGWCTSCHGVEMPHVDDFLKRHSKAAISRTDERCRRCHAPDDCVNCHLAHTHPGRTEGSYGGSILGSGGALQ